MNLKSYHLLMADNHGMFTKKLFEKLSDRDLSSGQPKILEYLSAHDGSVQKDIAAACGIEPATVTSLLARMEKMGLVIRETKNENRRSLYVSLTEKGRTESNCVLKAFDELDDYVLAGFSEAEKSDFLAYMSRVNRNLKGE